MNDGVAVNPPDTGNSMVYAVAGDIMTNSLTVSLRDSTWVYVYTYERE